MLLGDGEMAEGSVWEAADVALFHKLDNLCGIVDVNALGQSRTRSSTIGWTRSPRAGTRSAGTRSSSTATTSRRCCTRLPPRRAAKNHPTMILARTIKGKGVASVEGKDGWHGKAFKKGEEADKAIAELKAQLVPTAGASSPAIPPPAVEVARTPSTPDYSKMPPPSYKPGEQVATREAWGTALAALGAIDPPRRRARRRRQELDVQRPVREGVPRSVLSRTSSPSR